MQLDLSILIKGTLMRKDSGFTLIEIMVVVVILGILAAIVVPKIMSRPDEARIVKARQDILAVQSALDLYRLDNGIYPTTDQGLSALVEMPRSQPTPTNWKSYLKSLPIDPWNHPYQYLNPGEHGEIDIFHLWSQAGNPPRKIVRANPRLLVTGTPIPRNKHAHYPGQRHHYYGYLCDYMDFSAYSRTRCPAPGHSSKNHSKSFGSN